MSKSSHACALLLSAATIGVAASAVEAQFAPRSNVPVASTGEFSSIDPGVDAFLLAGEINEHREFFFQYQLTGSVANNGSRQTSLYAGAISSSLQGSTQFVTANSRTTGSQSFYTASINDAGTLVYSELLDDNFERWTRSGGVEKLLAPVAVRPAFGQPDDGTRPELFGIDLAHDGTIQAHGRLRNDEQFVGRFAQSTSSQPPLNEVYDTGSGFLADYGNGSAGLFGVRFAGSANRVFSGWIYDNGGGFDQGLVFIDNDSNVSIQETNVTFTSGQAISDNGKYGAYTASGSISSAIGFYDFDTDDILSGVQGDEDYYRTGEGVLSPLDGRQRLRSGISVNNDGRMAFRALDVNGGDAVWILDSSDGPDDATLRRVMGAGDTFLLDGTLIKLINEENPTFSPNLDVSLNDHGDLLATWRYAFADDPSNTPVGSVAIASLVPEPAGLTVLGGVIVLGLRRRRAIR